YKLVEVIGEGGMGTVWLAQQTDPVRRPVALKVIKAGMGTRQVVARFEAERQALALMDHPNIAKVLDGGVTPDGRPFFAMELVKGVPITKFCDERRLAPKDRLELFVPVCQAVQHAHQKGIIHRDLKPSNVLVALYDGRPVPKVIDFGVAKAAGQPLTDKTLVTGLGTVVGTPEYMSPEQAELNQLDVDTRSDVYALGVLLYELLTGTTPLQKKRVREAALLEVLRLVREEEAPRPSTRLSTTDELPSIAANRGLEPKRLSGLVRGELDWIVMKALEKDRARRYETATGFAADVRRYLDDEPVQACPPSAAYRLKKFARRNKGRLAVAAGVFVAATVMAASIGWAVRDRVARQAEIEQAESARLVQVEGQVRASLNAARTLIDENKLVPARAKLAQARAQLGNDGPALGTLAAEVEVGAADLDRFQQFLELIDRAHQAETAPLLENTSVVDGSSGLAATPAPAQTGERRPAAVVPFLLAALQDYGVLEGDHWNGTLESGLLGRQQVEQIRRTAYEELLWLADDVFRRRQAHRSEGTLSRDAAARQALAYLGRAEHAHRPTQAFYVLRARCRKGLGDEAAAQGDRQLADQTPATMAIDHALRGQAALDARQLAEGVQAFEAALRLEPTHYWSMMHLGYCLCDLGRGPEDYVAAARVFTGCLLKRPDHSHAFCCRGNAFQNLRRFDDAAADYTKAVELDPKHAHAWNNRGLTYLRMGQAGKAVVDFSLAIELDPKGALAWCNRGNAYYKLGKPDKAIADYSRAIALDPTHARAWTGRGAAYNELGHADKAVADHSRAIDLDPMHAIAWNNRGNAYHKLGQADEAIADYSKAIELDPTFAIAWRNRGNAYSKPAQADKAVADYSKAIDLDLTYTNAWVNRGLAYLRLRQPDKAVADFSKVIELDPKQAEAWAGRGLAYVRLGHADKALVDLSRAIDLDPNLARAWANRGAAYLQLSQPGQAVEDSSRAVELDPKLAIAWCNRGDAYYKLGQVDKAVADYSKAIDLDPNGAEGWCNRGNAYLRLRQTDKAIADHSRAIELDPQYARAWYGRGNASLRLGQRDEAIADYSRAIELSPKYATAWANRGLAYLQLGRPDRAVADCSRAVELDPKLWNVWSILGTAHYRAGNPKAAVTALHKSAELGPGRDAEEWFFLAMAHHRMGHHDEARKAYEQAVRWLDRNQDGLAKDKGQAEGLRRLRAEAEGVLELKKK
ncbi:MAG TPA: tetratricopeptide repeat protein, partial [Gemmataceae bacterium]|nr:tetratricopeptide repeat protein [Gemmataceae bacterium]